MKQFAALLCVCVATLIHDCTVEAACRHSLVTPKGLRLDSPDHIYIDFHDCGPVVSVTATLSSFPTKRSAHDQVIIQERAHENKPLKITLQPKLSSLEKEDGRTIFKGFLNVQYCFPPACGQRIKVKQMEILLNMTHGYIFMTTNKPAYRPKETVQFALALTDQSLRREDNPRPIRIRIKTPEERVTVLETEELFVDRDGFLEYSYKIGKEPMIGVWWAEAYINDVKMAEKSYVIDRYETPTFNVKILMDRHFILPDQRFIRGKVKAEYSYGEPVDGFIYMSFILARDGQEEEEFYKRPRTFMHTFSINGGEATFKVPIAELESVLRDGESILHFAENPGSAKVIVTASVTGYTEGVFESDVVDNIQFTTSPFVIDYSQSAKYFLPNTIYEIKLVIRDVVSNLPLPGIPVTVQWGTPRKDRNFVSNPKGEVKHNVNLEEEEETIRIKTRGEDFGNVDQILAEFTVERTDETHHLALQISERIIDVGGTQHVTFQLGRASPPNIRYFVLSRGQIVHSGVKDLTDDQHGDVPVDFDVTDEMVPHARVVGYYILENALASNSIWFDVVNVCKNELEINLPKPKVKPGDRFPVSISGEPNVAFFLSAIDRAAYFIHNGTRVNRDLLWSKMETYDTACSRKGGREAINVFEEAGLIINSPVVALRKYDYIDCVHSRKKRNAQPAPPPQSESLLAKKCYKHGERKVAGTRTCEMRANKVEQNLLDQQKDQSYINTCKQSFLTACKHSIQQGSSHRASLARRASSAADRADEVRARVRSNFGENIIFAKDHTRNNGVIEKTLRAEDSITTFEFDAFGMSNAAPMCVAKTKELKIFQDFFIQLYLPYSVRLREQAIIRFSVFNYREEQVTIPVQIRHSKELCSKFAHDNFQLLEIMTIEPRSARASSFTVMPLEIPVGKLATIEINAGGDDAIKKTLLIEEAGQRNESSKTIVLVASQIDKEVEFDVSKFAVMPDTLKCELFAHAHPMGPSIEIEGFDDALDNLDGFINKPCGCGEQNMLRIGPIVFVHLYRKNVDEASITDKLHTQTLNHIQEAYRIELSWRSDSVQKKAFAVWNHKPPSTWLNAYVNRVFSSAFLIWEGMNTQPFCDSLTWLLSMQNAVDGSFRENYRVHHQEMIGQIKKNQDDYTITLTAYVSIAIRESLFMCSDPDLQVRYQRAVDAANNYLITREQDAITPYALAMGAYSLALADRNSINTRKWIQWLNDEKENDGEYIYWRGTRGRASTIETTAYALMAELTYRGITEVNDELTRNTAYWLISQQNDMGGFVSTQDTVVGLQALAMYMRILETSVSFRPPVTNLRISVRGKSEDSPWHDQPAEFHLTPSDDMKRQNKTVDSGTIAGGIVVRVEGEGTGSLSYRCRWRQYTDAGKCQFDVDVSMESDQGEEDPKTRTLKVNVRKVIGPPAQLSIVEVGLLSGYKPDIDSIKKLCIEDAVDAEADRYEIVENKIIFYLTRIDAEGAELAFKIKREVDIGNGQPAVVTAYDYYESDIRCTKFYNEHGEHEIQSICDKADQGDDRPMCRCAEGDCPICRTRADQLEATVCSKFRQIQRLCNITQPNGRSIPFCRREECTNIHQKGCESEFVYVVNVLEVARDEIPGFKYFMARIDEVFRATANHRQAEGSIVKFLIRDDCFKKCYDERYAEIAAAKTAKTGQHVEPLDFISEGRDLLIHGGHPRKVENGGNDLYVYELTRKSHGIEAVLPASKCFCDKNDVKCKKRLKKGNKDAICRMKSLLWQSITEGCD